VERDEDSYAYVRMVAMVKDGVDRKDQKKYFFTEAYDSRKNVDQMT